MPELSSEPYSDLYSELSSVLITDLLLKIIFKPYKMSLFLVSN